MLSKTLDETMAKSKKFETHTKVSKFGNIIQNMRQEQNFENELLMMQKISDYVKPQQISSQDDEIQEYITENTDTIVPIIDFSNGLKTGLPFFKSLEYKLSEAFGS